MEVKMMLSRRNKTLLCVVLLLSALIFPVFSAIYQSPLYESSSTDTFVAAPFLEQNKYTLDSFTAQTYPDKERMVVIASTSEDYRMVPGDSFSLAYFSGNEVITGIYQVDSRYLVTIPEVGVFDCHDMPFTELKDQILQSLIQSRPYSSPRIDFVSCGFFQVSVIGEVSSNVPVTCWGGSTLRSTMANAGQYASSRSVKIIKPGNASTASYDLFLAINTGDRKNDPALRPGDVVEYSKASRIVVLDGAVYNPGTFQLLPNENLGELIRNYGKGLLPSADISSISIQHVEAGKATTRIASDNENEKLYNMDRVSVVETTLSNAYVTVEGAIAPGQSTAEATALSGLASRLIYSFFPGERVSQLLKNISGAFVSQSDLDNIYLVRDSKKIALESGKLIAGTAADDPILQEGDRLFVPFVQMFVTVNGSVNSPGRVAFVPDKDASYYIGLSGGYSNNARRVGSYHITDSSGNKLDKDALIPNGAVISVDTNNFARDLGVVASVVALVASVINAVYYVTLIAK